MNQLIIRVQFLILQRKPTLRASEDCLDDESTDAQFEDSDNLHDLVRSPLSPWHEEASWSPQALVLKELAIKAPDQFNPDFIYSSLKTLRIVDKGVSKVFWGGFIIKTTQGTHKINKFK